jgi:hypothetical protein
MVAYICNLSYSGGRGRQKCETLPEKQTKNSKRTGHMAQVVEHLPSKLTAVSLISSTARKKKNYRKKPWSFLLLLILSLQQT